MNVRGLSLFLLSGLFLLPLGCGSDQEDTVPVSGTVMLDGAPLANASVVFAPVDGEGKQPSGMTNDKGEFTLRTYEENDGAPEGEYRVTIVKAAEVESNTGEDLEKIKADSLPVRYGQPENSGLTATVPQEKYEFLLTSDQ